MGKQLITILVITLALMGCSLLNQNATEVGDMAISLNEDNSSYDPHSENNESQFKIALPLASYDWGMCLETPENHCEEAIDIPEDIFIANSFEIWHETQLTFTIVPHCNDLMTLMDDQTLSLELYDPDTQTWSEVPFYVMNPDKQLFNSEYLKFVSICNTDGKTGELFPNAYLITILFAPPVGNTQGNLTYKLTVKATKIDTKTGNYLPDEFVASKVIDYYLPQKNETLSNVWTGIDIEPDIIAKANENFTLFAPKNYNPYLIPSLLHSDISHVKLVLNIISNNEIQFDPYLGIEVYQYNSNENKWMQVNSSPDNQTFSSIKNFVYSPEQKNTICNGCLNMYSPVENWQIQAGVPRMMAGENDYLLFQMYIDPADLESDEEPLRIIARAGDQIAFVDLPLLWKYKPNPIASITTEVE
ncbi:MAG: hypothetical protein HPY85_06585 [Anaerolineae bacterium]|nr:hypothetical protein [Anaerolineae bacterium]